MWLNALSSLTLYGDSAVLVPLKAVKAHMIARLLPLRAFNHAFTWTVYALQTFTNATYKAVVSF